MNQNTPMSVAAVIAQRLTAKRAVSQFGAIANPEQRAKFDQHDAALHRLVAAYIPLGGSIIRCEFDEVMSSYNLLIFAVTYQHKTPEGNRNTEHTVRVRPAFFGLGITCTGRNTGGALVKLIDTFDHALSVTVRPCDDGVTYFPAPEAA